MSIPLADEVDEALAMAKAVMRGSAVQQIRRLRVERFGECIVMDGRVSSFYHKQVAQELIRCKLPDITVVNEIQVCGESE